MEEGEAKSNGMVRVGDSSWENGGKGEAMGGESG